MVWYCQIWKYESFSNHLIDYSREYEFRHRGRRQCHSQRLSPPGPRPQRDSKKFKSKGFQRSLSHTKYSMFQRAHTRQQAVKKREVFNNTDLQETVKSLSSRGLNKDQRILSLYFTFQGFQSSPHKALKKILNAFIEFIS